MVMIILVVYKQFKDHVHPLMMLNIDVDLKVLWSFRCASVAIMKIECANANLINKLCNCYTYHGNHISWKDFEWFEKRNSSINIILLQRYLFDLLLDQIELVKLNNFRSYSYLNLHLCCDSTSSKQCYIAILSTIEPKLCSNNAQWDYFPWLSSCHKRRQLQSPTVD